MGVRLILTVNVRTDDVSVGVCVLIVQGGHCLTIILIIDEVFGAGPLPGSVVINQLVQSASLLLSDTARLTGPRPLAVARARRSIQLHCVNGWITRRLYNNFSVLDSRNATARRLALG